MVNNVFISFKSQDRELILPLYNRLLKERFSVFMSSEDLEGGDKWMDRLGNVLKDSKVLIAFITQNYVNYPYQVGRELDMADRRQIAIIPVLYKISMGEIPPAWEYLFSSQLITTGDLTETIINKIVNSCKSIFSGKTLIGKSAKDVYEEGVEYLRQQDFLNASLRFEKACNDYNIAYIPLIFSRLMLKQYMAAREAAREAQKFCPLNPDSYFFSAMANLAGREEFTSAILERATEQLQKAASMEYHIQHSYLAFCLAFLYEKRSFIVPSILVSLIDKGKKQEFNQALFDEVRILTGL